MRQHGHRSVSDEAARQHPADDGNPGVLGYRVVVAPDYDALIRTLAQPSEVRVALRDLSDFERSAWRLCDALQRHRVCFLVLCPLGGGQALQHGGAGFLQKPAQKPLLLPMGQGLAGEAADVAS